MPRLALFLSLIVFSQVGNIVRFSDASPLAVCFWRLLFSCLLIGPILLWRARWREIAGLDFRQLSLCAISGVSLFLVFSLFVVGIQATTVANTTILFSLHPLLTALGASFLFGEKISSKLSVALAFGFLGVVALFGESLTVIGGGMTGHLAALGSAFFFSSYLLSGKMVRERLDNTTFTFLIYSIASLCAAASMLYNGETFSEYSDQSWLAFLALAIGPTVLGHAVFTWCLKHLNVNVISCTSLVHVPLAAIGSYFLFSENITWFTMLSFGFACFSILILFAPNLAPATPELVFNTEDRAA